MALSRNEKITIGAAIISSPLISIIFDLVRAVPILSTFKSVYSWLLNIFTIVFTYEIQVWIVLLIFILLFVVLYIYGSRDSNNTPNPQFNYLKYTEDTILGLKWTWTYELDKNTNKYVVSNMIAYCPNCDSPLRPKNYFLDQQTECIRCDFSRAGNVYGDMHRIESLIIDNVARLSKSNISGG